MSSISPPTPWPSPWMSHGLQLLLPHHHCPPSPLPQVFHLLVSLIPIFPLLPRSGPCLLALLKSGSSPLFWGPSSLGSFYSSAPLLPSLIFSSDTPIPPSAPAVILFFLALWLRLPLSHSCSKSLRSLASPTHSQHHCPSRVCLSKAGHASGCKRVGSTLSGPQAHGCPPVFHLLFSRVTASEGPVGI